MPLHNMFIAFKAILRGKHRHYLNTNALHRKGIVNS
jgi:hypothetical protein